jgi:hypothetical protein
MQIGSKLYQDLKIHITLSGHQYKIYGIWETALAAYRAYFGRGFFAYFLVFV